MYVFSPQILPMLVEIRLFEGLLVNLNLKFSKDSLSFEIIPRILTKTFNQKIHFPSSSFTLFSISKMNNNGLLSPLEQPLYLPVYHTQQRGKGV